MRCIQKTKDEWIWWAFTSMTTDHEAKEVTVAQTLVPEVVSLAQPLAKETHTLPIS